MLRIIQLGFLLFAFFYTQEAFAFIGTPVQVDVSKNCSAIRGEADAFQYNFWAQHNRNSRWPRYMRSIRRRLIHFMRYWNNKPYGVVAIEDGSAEFIGVFIEKSRFGAELYAKANGRVKAWIKKYSLYEQTLNQLMDQVAVYSEQMLLLKRVLRHGINEPIEINHFPTTVNKQGEIVYKKLVLTSPQRARELRKTAKNLRAGLLGNIFGVSKMYDVQLDQVRLEWRLRMLQEQLFIKIHEARSPDDVRDLIEVKAQVDTLLADPRLRPSPRIRSHILNKELLNDIRATALSIRQNQYSDFIQQTLDKMPEDYKKRMGIDKESLKSRFSIKKRFLALVGGGGGTGVIGMASLLRHEETPEEKTFKDDIVACVQVEDEQAFKNCLYEAFGKRVLASEVLAEVGLTEGEAKRNPQKFKDAYLAYFAKHFPSELAEINQLREDALLEKQYYLTIERAIDEALEAERNKVLEEEAAQAEEDAAPEEAPAEGS